MKTYLKNAFCNLYFVIGRLFPIVGGVICIFTDEQYLVKNRKWFVPYHWATGTLLILAIDKVINAL